MLPFLQSAAGMPSLGNWLLLGIALLLGLYLLGTWNYDYFARRGVPYFRPALPFLGHTGAAFVGLKPLPDAIKELYDRAAGLPVAGIFEFTSPQFMVRDPEVLKAISVKEFDSFPNHRGSPDDEVKLNLAFTRNLFSLRGQEWRDMRATLSPAFTSSKLKGMFKLINECSGQLADHIEEKYEAAGTSGPLELNTKDLFTRFTNDVIATTAFGVRCDSLKEPRSEFYRMGRKVATFRMWSVAGYLMAPRLMWRLGVELGDPKATAYFDRLVHETIRERKEKGIFRPDMLQLLMQARDGSLKAEEGEEEDAPPRNQAKKLELTDVDITAQAIIFLFGGFDSVSNAMCYAAYALAAHPEVQERLYREVDALLSRTGGSFDLSYEDITGFKYLDMVISESLRLYPPATATDRQCAAACTVALPGDRPPLHFRKGDVLWLPVHGIHRDPQYWPDPEKFNPDRFSDENKHKIKPFTYMPFGLGPRVCIGQRLALLELKLALLRLVARFQLLPAARTPVPVEYARGGGMNVAPRGGFVLALRPRRR